VTGVVAGNISDEATTRLGNIFAEAMRGLARQPSNPALRQQSGILSAERRCEVQFSRWAVLDHPVAVTVEVVMSRA
jgi:hypothetical protein